MKKSLILGLLCFLLASVFAVAQDTTQPATTPHISKYLWISTGAMNPGKEMVFTNLVKQIKDAAATNSADYYWLAGYNITGPDHDVSFVSFHDDLASVDKTITTWEKIQRTAMMKNANLMTESAEAGGAGSSILAKYREDLSFNPMKLDPAHTTRWLVETYYLKPGTMMEAEDLVKEEMDLVKKADPDDHWLTYQVIAGGSGSTLMMVVPLRTLADLDEMDKKSEAMKAVFTPPVRRRLSSVVKEIVLKTRTELIAVSPEMSRPPQALVAANPDFWTVKEQAPVMATKGKKTKKAPVEPAAMKEEKKQ